MDRRKAIETALERIGHIERLRVLEACAQGPKSAKDLAPTQPAIGRVSYHFRTLLDAKLIKRHSVKQVRGTIQRFYVISAPGLRLLDSLGLDDEL